MTELNTTIVHESWLPIIKHALSKVDPIYLSQLKQNENWLPGAKQIFNAFSLPLHKIRYILFGESPYPRQQSANGYAFWDAAVDDIWSDNGLSKAVNRATSLRNFIKMLLLADQQLTIKTLSQNTIAQLDKQEMVKTLKQLFEKMIDHGFLLLNASLVLSDNKVHYDAKAWQPFMSELLSQIANKNLNIELILFGKIAQQIDKFPATKNFDKLYAEHPYNISFITNAEIINFFKPLKLLEKR